MICNGSENYGTTWNGSKKSMQPKRTVCTDTGYN
jgi:hypothetical protein